MSSSGLIFFFLFAIILVGVYIAIRRQLAPFSLLAGGGVFAGIIAMTLFSLTQENVLFIHALMVGILIGGGMSLGVILIAWYFLKQETADRKSKGLM
jgi:hypothetical protein